MSKLAQLINQSGYDFFFLVVDKFLDISVPELENFHTIFDPELATKNSGFLLSQPSTQNMIADIVSKTGRKVAIVPFKPSAKIEHICKTNNWLLVANPSSLSRLLEDKIKFFEICQKNNLPVVPGIIDSFSENNFINAQKTLGDTLVIQTHFGWAGNSSHLANNYKNVQGTIPQNTVVKFSKYLPGYSLINNCCQTAAGIIQSPPGLQYTGIKTLTINPLATVGRQWPCFAPSSVQNQVKEITEQFSSLLANLNYQGFFGLDFLVSKNIVYLLECNPRLTASFAFYTNIELNNGLEPLFFYHILEFLHQVTTIHDPFYSHLIGSEITLKNNLGTTVKRYHDFVAFSPSCEPISINSEIIAKLS